jgi:hypothetical protein
VLVGGSVVIGVGTGVGVGVDEGGGDGGGGEGVFAGGLGAAGVGRFVGVTVLGFTVVDGTGETRVRCGPTCERACCDGLGIAGAWTTLLRPGPGPSAIPCGVGEVASRRGINAPPPTAIASRRAETTRSFPLMFSPSPADNIPTRTIGRREDSLEIGGS